MPKCSPYEFSTRANIEAGKIRWTVTPESEAKAIFILYGILCCLKFVGDYYSDLERTCFRYQSRSREIIRMVKRIILNIIPD